MDEFISNFFLSIRAVESIAFFFVSIPISFNISMGGSFSIRRFGFHVFMIREIHELWNIFGHISQLGGKFEESSNICLHLFYSLEFIQ